MKKRKVILFNICLIVLIFIMFKFSLINDALKYIKFQTKECNFKDLLSISATVLTVFLGFIVTAITVIISMCDRRIMKLVKELGKISILYRSMKKSIVYGLISLLGISIMYINADFNIIELRLFIIWVVLNSLFIFSYYSMFLLKFMKLIIEKMFFSNEELVVTASVKNKQK